MKKHQQKVKEEEEDIILEREVLGSSSSNQRRGLPQAVPVVKLKLPNNKGNNNNNNNSLNRSIHLFFSFWAITADGKFYFQPSRLCLALLLPTISIQNCKIQKDNDKNNDKFVKHLSLAYITEPWRRLHCTPFFTITIYIQGSGSWILKQWWRQPPPQRGPASPT